MPVGKEYGHLTDADLAAIIEMVERKAAAFWVEGTPRTTVKFFTVSYTHLTLPTNREV